MIREILAWADVLDTWLKEHVGRLYNALLGVSLITSISASFTTISKAVGSPKDLTTLGVVVAFQIALLINQLAQLHHFREDRVARRAARLAEKTGALPAPDSGAD
ncbi:MAG TPA: hypothetical protein VGI95_15805 [Caulobacteraceae bacterium]|jgi:hypothetical protein